MTLFCIEETLLGSGFQLRLSRLVFRLKGKASSKPTPSRCRTLHNASFVSRIKKLVNFQTPESRYLVVSVDPFSSYRSTNHRRLHPEQNYPPEMPSLIPHFIISFSLLSFLSLSLSFLGLIRSDK